MLVANMGVSIVGITGEFEAAIRRLQVGIWQCTMRMYENGNISNEKLEKLLLDGRDDGEFAEWFFAGGEPNSV